MSGCQQPPGHDAGTSSARDVGTSPVVGAERSPSSGPLAAGGAVAVGVPVAIGAAADAGTGEGR